MDKDIEKKRKKAKMIAKKLLKKIKRTVIATFDTELLEDWDIKVKGDFEDYYIGILTTDLAIFKFDYCIWGQKIKEVENEWVEDYHIYPSNWWEALKGRWLPEWWKRRHPIKYDKIKTVIHRTQSFYNIYPHIDDWIEGYLHKEIIKDIHKQ